MMTPAPPLKMTQGGNDPLTPLHRLSTASLSGVVRCVAIATLIFRYFLRYFLRLPPNKFFQIPPDWDLSAASWNPGRAPGARPGVAGDHLLAQYQSLILVASEILSLAFLTCRIFFSARPTRWKMRLRSAKSDQRPVKRNQQNKNQELDNR